MRIPSIKKIEKQVEEYMDGKNGKSLYYYIPEDCADIYWAIWDEFCKKREEWEDMVSDCPVNSGGKCTCKDHPLYKSFYIDEVCVLCEIVNMFQYECFGLRDDERDEYLNKLMKIRELKISQKDLRKYKD